MIKANRFQRKKVAKGKLLNKRFKFKKDDDTRTHTPVYTFGDVLTDLSGVSKNGVFIGKLEGEGFSLRLKDIEARIVPEDEMPANNILGDQTVAWIEKATVGGYNMAPDFIVTHMDEHMDEKQMTKLYNPDLKEEPIENIEELLESAHPSEILRSRYDELVTQLAMVVADRIKSFKKRNALMYKLTGEDYGFLEHSNWATSETTTFKYWPASWKFERCIGTSTIFEARFHHTTFELIDYRTIFMADSKRVVVRDPNAKIYSLDNDSDLVDIIQIYEKAIDFVYDRGKK